MKSWKTTVGGILLAVGTSLGLVEDATLKTIGVILAAVGGALLGLNAKDKDITGPNSLKIQK
jgi:hypothetical protein